MPRKITDACIACGTCSANCPVECIAEGDIYGKMVLVINCWR